jgi:PPOX class probable F420-dependent enzyme
MLTERQAAYFQAKNWGLVATLRPDGSPHVTPVWVDSDGEDVFFNTKVGGAKERHLRRDPRVTVTVVHQQDPQRGYVSVSGTATLSEDGAFEHLDRLASKYVGFETYPWLGPGERRVIVRVHPRRVNAEGEAA